MTGNSAIKKLRRKRWPGLKEAAKQLGVSYGHLRLCVAGERASRSLRNRYRAWKNQHRTAPKTTNVPSPKAQTKTFI